MVWMATINPRYATNLVHRKPFYWHDGLEVEPVIVVVSLLAVVEHLPTHCSCSLGDVQCDRRVPKLSHPAHVLDNVEA